MTKEQIIMIRTRLKRNKDVPLGIIGNNLVLYTELRDVIHWDDEKEIITVIRQNTDQGTNTIRPYEVCMFTYADVQDLRACFNEENFVACATEAGLTALNIEMAQKRFGSVKPEDFLK